MKEQLVSDIDDLEKTGRTPYTVEERQTFKNFSELLELDVSPFKYKDPFHWPGRMLHILAKITRYMFMVFLLYKAEAKDYNSFAFIMTVLVIFYELVLCFVYYVVTIELDKINVKDLSFLEWIVNRRSNMATWLVLAVPCNLLFGKVVILDFYLLLFTVHYVISSLILGSRFESNHLFIKFRKMFRRV
jgi:hypothetical protein